MVTGTKNLRKQMIFVLCLMISITFSYGIEYEEEENLNRTASDRTDRIGSDRTDRIGSDRTDRIGSDRTDRIGSDRTDRIASDRTDRIASNSTTSNAGSLSQCPMHPKPSDCEQVLENGYTENGIYNIWPKSRVTQCQTISVYCDMKTMGGGWTVIQRRGDFGNPEDYFRKSWNQYKIGFGKLRLEFWLGNDKIYALTNQDSYSIRFDLTNRNGESKYAMYDHFWIDDDERKYKLHLGSYSGGDAGDALGPDNNKDFYTHDKDGNGHSGGWWHNVFPGTTLNGLNKKSDFKGKDNIMWDPMTGYENSLLATEIKIRSNSI